MAYGSILGQNPTAQNTLYNNAQTSSIITANNVQGAIDQLFTSVRNGKHQIPRAITDKDVSTSADDTFATMAENIGKISTGDINLSIFANDGGNMIPNSGKLHSYDMFMIYTWYPYGYIKLIILTIASKKRVDIEMSFPNTSKIGEYTSNYQNINNDIVSINFGINSSYLSTITLN